MKAEAEQQAAILRADGEAQAILAVQKALADSLAMLNQAAPNDQVIKLKALEAMQKVADGKATKIIIPSEIQGLAAWPGASWSLSKTESNPCRGPVRRSPLFFRPARPFRRAEGFIPGRRGKIRDIPCFSPNPFRFFR